MSCLLILGGGGHAKVVAETALASGDASSVVFLDDSPISNVLGMPVLGPLHLALKPEFQAQYPVAIVAIGNSVSRMTWINRLQANGYRLPYIIHPSASISPSAKINPASVVLANSAIQSEAVVGKGVIINTSSSIDHESTLADGVHICPGAHLAGEVSVGSRSWIGIGSSVIQQVHIGSDVIVGAGAVVLRDLPNNVTAAGVPARIIAGSH